MASSKGKSPRPIQIRSGRWYALGHAPPKGVPKEAILLYGQEECCDCGLVHDATIKLTIKNGKPRLWVKWDVNDAETRSARRRPQRFVRRSTRSGN